MGRPGPGHGIMAIARKRPLLEFEKSQERSYIPPTLDAPVPLLYVPALCWIGRIPPCGVDAVCETNLT